MNLSDFQGEENERIPDTEVPTELEKNLENSKAVPLLFSLHPSCVRVHHLPCTRATETRGIGQRACSPWGDSLRAREGGISTEIFVILNKIVVNAHGALELAPSSILRPSLRISH